MARELKRPGVTMTILCEEYREAHPGGYGYSRFCDLLRDFERRLTPVIRQQDTTEFTYQLLALNTLALRKATTAAGQERSLPSPRALWHPEAILVMIPLNLEDIK